MDSTLSATTTTTTTVFRRSNTLYHSTTGAHFHRNQVAFALLNVRQTSAAARAEFRRPLVGVPVCVSRSDVFLDSGGGGGGGGGGESGDGGGGGGGGEVEVDPVMVGVDDGSDVSFDVIVLNVGGMTCGGCSGKVKRILESQPLVSAASVNHQTKMAIVWPVPEAKVTPNWQRVLGEELAKHLTTCGFDSNLRGGRGTRDRIPFRWGPRLAVAQGVARAMEHLHTNLNSTLVPHGNLKSSNVLIDENNMALVSDYGLTSIISNTISVHRMVAFKSPEYIVSKKVSKKSDVWSYGSLVMELLTGRVSVLSGPQDDKAVDLCSWVHRAVREEWTAEIFDLELMVQRSAIHGMLKLLQLAVSCCDKVPEKRPDMSDVVKEVESIKVPNIDSESEEDFSVDRSLTDDSMSATPSR